MDRNYPSANEEMEYPDTSAQTFDVPELLTVCKSAVYSIVMDQDAETYVPVNEEPKNFAEIHYYAGEVYTVIVEFAWSENTGPAVRLTTLYLGGDGGHAGMMNDAFEALEKEGVGNDPIEVNTYTYTFDVLGIRELFDLRFTVERIEQSVEKNHEQEGYD